MGHLLWSSEMLMPNVAVSPPVSTSDHKPDDLRREILLIEPDTAVLSAHTLLLSNSNYCVSSALCDGELFALRHKKAVAFAILSASLGRRGLRASAEVVRRQWPLSRILILGRSAFRLEDHLYDEQIDLSQEPKQLLGALDRLSEEPRNQSVITADSSVWRSGLSLVRSFVQETDPTKISPLEQTTTDNPRGKQSDIRSWQL
jgi:hypothetical protein